MIQPTTITLFTETAHGVFDTIGTNSRTVYAEIADVGMNEYYLARSAGLSPEITFELTDYSDYNGEKRLTHDSKAYRVIRAYRRGQRQRLVCERVDVNDE